MKFLVVVIGIFFFVGCSSTNQNIENTVYKSTKHIERMELKKNYYLVAENVTVESSNRFLAYIPLTIMPLTVDGRIDSLSLELLNKYNGDILTDVKVETGWLFTLYYNTYTYYLTGNVWQRKDKN